MAKLELTSSVDKFEKLRTTEYLYVDKTEYLWKLIRLDGGMYFLSRPRRFGKSLTVSTLKAIFQGKKEFFKGLAIYDRPYDWKKHPVIHLDMNGWDFGTEEKLQNDLRGMIKEQAKANGVRIAEDDATAMFRMLINKVSKKGSVIVLVDEYDKPILNNIGEPSANDILKTLRAFYSVIKEKSAVIRFVFVTGVTKLCHVSLFSDLNNLMDISMDANYATMLGYTQSEFETNFKEWIAYTETGQDLSHDEFLAEIKSWYDGYRFEETAESVYNPVSLANFFIFKGKFDNYWFSTGTPTFLFELMKKSDFDFSGELNSAVSKAVFNSFELTRMDPLVLLYQTGYVTIAECRRRKIEYTEKTVTEYLLKFPNREVEESFNESLLENYAGVMKKDSPSLIRKLVKSVGDGDVEQFIKLLKGVFASIPYDILKHEHYYQTIIYVVFDMLRFFIEAEHRTSDGRIDLMLTAGNWIYVVELKMDRSADAAMKQIGNKDYALKFLNRGKRIMAIGINFDSGRGQISDWLKEEIKAI